MSIVCLAKKLPLTKSGTHLLFGALCPDEGALQLEQRLQELEGKLCADTADPYGIDLWLAETAAEICPPGTLAAALSVNAWAKGPVSGGVIGAPHEEPASADGELEKLAEDLWCWSRPESPGFVICGHRRDAIGARDALCTALERGEEPWGAFSVWLQKNPQVRTYLFLLDGCGQRGVLAAGDKKHAILLEM